MIPRQVFTDRLNGLDRAERTGFLAALWAARGWTVTVRVGEAAGNGEPVVVAEREAPIAERVTIEPVAVDGGAGAETADRFTTDGRFEVVVRAGGPSQPGPIVRRFEPDDLYAMVRYGVDRERRAELFRDHLENGDTPIRSGRSAVRNGERAESDQSRAGSLSAALPVVVVVILIVGALVAGATADGVAAPFTAEQADGKLRFVLQCGDHPVAVAPATLLPQFTEDGVFSPAAWEEVPDPLTASENRFRGSPVTTPVSRAVATYLGPDDRQYRVDVARWRTDWLAADAADRATESTVRVTWAWWSFDVQVLSSTGQRVKSPAAAATGRALLEAVELPPSVGLDPACTAQIARL